MLPTIPQRLSRPVRQWFEDSFQANFSQVRIHFNLEPAYRQAVAFASGERVVLLPQLDGTPLLLPVLAHELAHVVQQRGLQHTPGASQLREFEAEARAWEMRWPAGYPQGVPLFETACDDGQFGNLIQCASSGYALIPEPTAALAGGLQYFTKDNLKKSFREAIEHYVRLVRPGDVEGVTGNDPNSRKNYVNALYKRIQSKPYLLKELVGDKKVAFDDLGPADRRWVKDELFRAWDKLRKTTEHMPITTRICLGHTPSWMDFRTKDCVFAAILRTLTTIDSNRVNPRGMRGDVGATITDRERDEAAMETWLASYLGVARALTPDVQLIHILEFELGWKNQGAVQTFSDLKKGEYKGKTYIVSYERTAGTDSRDAFWHTVYVDIGSGGKVTVVDRQAAGEGLSGSISESAKCDAWLIDKGTTGYLAMKRAFDERT